MTNKQLLEQILRNQKIVDAKMNILLLNTAMSIKDLKISTKEEDVAEWEKLAEEKVRG